MASKTRGLAGSLLDWTVSKLGGLPPATNTYTITPVRIPISTTAYPEPVYFAADLYRPIFVDPNQAPSGTILSINPYGLELDTACLNARPFAERGYQVLLVCCRGTYGSGGTIDPCRTEAEDARAVLHWMRSQDWYTGSFATFGFSYGAYTQWALMAGGPHPEDHVAAAVAIGPHDFGHHFVGSGALNMDAVVWSGTVAKQEDYGPFAAMFLRTWSMATSLSGFRKLLGQTPLVDALERNLAGRPAWQEWNRYVATHSDLEDDFFVKMGHSEALERTNASVLITSGWYDMFMTQAIEQYRRLSERGCNVSLIIGPWTHASASTSGLSKEALAWFDKSFRAQSIPTLAGDKTTTARIFVGGVGEWRQFIRWPPQTMPFELFLRAGERLTTDPPVEETSSSSFTYNPKKPTPTVGGALLDAFSGGSLDDSILATREDVVSFTSEVLDRDIEVHGQPTVSVSHVSDIPYVDLFVRISEVDSKGRSRNVTETYRRLDSSRGAEPVILSLRDCAHAFRKGTRIRLLIAGGCFPLFGRNSGTGENSGAAKELHAAKHTVRHQKDQVSKLVLPTV